jgi:hypothetical protein
MAEGTIEITRTSIYGRSSRVSLFLDGKKKALIGYNKTISLSLPSGRHSLYAKTSWIKSNELQFEITENQSRHLTVSNRTMPFWKYWLMLILSSICLVVGATFGPLGAGLGGGIGGLLYSRTIRRLHLQEETIENTA